MCFALTNPISDIAASIEVLLNPMNMMALPPTINHRRLNRSLFAPHTMKAMVTVMMYNETYYAAWVGSSSWVATTAAHALRDGTIQKLMPYERAEI
jgi:hypothetical protein